MVFLKANRIQQPFPKSDEKNISWNTVALDSFSRMGVEEIE